MSHAERERYRQANQLVDEYMQEWLEEYRGNISVLTYISYLNMMKARLLPYFKSLKILMKDVTGDEINAFYSKLRKEGLSGTTGQRYHAFLHLMFKQAVKRRIIPTNPCEQADRPRGNQYIGTYYNSEEIKKHIECLDDEPIRLPIILAAYYGLRRSEVLGLKWDAIDWVEDKILIKHKIIENKLEGNRVEDYDVMKNKSSYRTMPLIPFIREVLLEERNKQEEMKRVFRGAYIDKYTEYVCVDAMGNIFTPNYISRHFSIVLKRNSLKKIRFHDLRHSCASLLLSNKVSMKLIQDWLGHSDMGTTANIYSHIDYASKKESANIIGTVLTN